MKKLAFVLGLAILLSPGMSKIADAAETPKKASKQVMSGLYVTAKEAWDLMQADQSAILIDVRDPIEVMFTGFTDEADLHVPFIMADKSAKHPKMPVYNLKKNPNFLKEVIAGLEAKNVSKTAPIIVMCRSGSTRSAPAADMLYKAGYTQAYTMVDGFEGSKSKSGPSKGVRDVNGWRNSGLPWSYKLNFEKMYITSSN